MTKALAVILGVVTLDAIGTGLIFPILPTLLQSITGSGEVSVTFGIIMALYALMQLIFSPLLGALSDRFGRRPVLLLSLAGAAIDYIVMAWTPWLSLLVISRAIAGITGASMSVAGAYIADVTPEDQRARRFGWMSACFGIGFIIGPALGGILGDWGVRLPFVAAAAFNALNFLLGLFVLPESRVAKGGKLDWKALNPLAPLGWAFSVKALVPLLVITLVFGLIAGIPGTIWVLYGADRFGWNTATIGLSLTVFGVCHAGSQAFLAGPISERLGETRTIMLSMLTDGLAFVIIGFATQGWVAFALGPLFALGGLGQAALQSMMSRTVGEDKQGELQGISASVQALASVIGPIAGTAIYAATAGWFLGTVWIIGAVMYALTLPVLILWARKPAETPATA